MQAPQAYTLPPELYVKAVHFADARYALYFAGVAFSALVLYAILRLRIADRLNRYSAPIYFAAILLLVAIVEIPVDAAWQALSLHFGISKQSWPSWLWDWGKGVAVATAIGTIVLWPLYAVMRRRPRSWWLIAWLGALPLLVLGAYADPLIIEPLFNHFSPLSAKHPELIPQIEALLHRAGVNIPPDHLFEMSASEKTNAVNAYVSGFGPSRRLVLYDTIIRQEEGPMLLTTIGHELGHYVLDHIAKGLMLGALGLLVALWILQLALTRFVRIWGPAFQMQSVADRKLLPVLLMFALMLNFFSDPIANAYSRRQEHEADVYSLEVTHGIIPDPGQAAARAFQIEGQIDLDVPNPDRFIVFWLYSHPPTADRLRFSLEYDPWRSSSHPRFIAH